MSNSKNRKRATVSRPASPPLGGRRAGPDVFVGYLHPGQVSAYFAHSLTGLLLYDRSHNQRVANIVNEWSSANISQARNNVVRLMLDNEHAEWMFFIDSDMAFEPDALDAMLAVADPKRAPVVGGLCFGQHDGKLFPTIYQLTQDEKGRPITVRATDYRRDAMVQVAATGAAFLLIHRSVLEAIERRSFNAVYPWFQETELAGLPAGEDVTFCLRAGMVGYNVWVNTSVRVGHHKSRLLTEDDFVPEVAAPQRKSTAFTGTDSVPDFRPAVDRINRSFRINGQRPADSGDALQEQIHALAQGVPEGVKVP